MLGRLLLLMARTCERTLALFSCRAQHYEPELIKARTPAEAANTAGKLHIDSERTSHLYLFQV